MISFCFLFAGFLILFSLSKNKALNFIQFVFAFAAAAFSLVGILNFYNNTITRSNAILGDRVFDAEFLVSIISFLLFAAIIKINAKRLPEYLMLFFSIISLLYMIILRTRAGWIATIIIAAIMIIILRNSKIVLFRPGIIRLGIIVIFAIILSALIPFSKDTERPDLFKTAESIFSTTYNSNQSRINFWNVSLKMFSDNPICGIGKEKWAGHYPLYAGESYNDENIDMNIAINPHNDFLEILAEYGLTGFLFAVGFIIFGLYFLYKKTKTDIIYLPFLLSALGVCITMFFSFTKDNFWAMLIFSICMSVGYSFNNQLSIINYEFFKKNKVILKRFLLIAALIFLGVGIWFKVMSYLNEREYIESMQLKAQGKYSEMLEKLDGVSSFYYPVDMNKMPVDYYRGIGYFELKQFDKALEKFRSARNYMNYYPAIMNNEASALYMTGNYKESLEKYLEIKRLFPNYIEPQINLLSFYTNQNRYEEAKSLITELDTKSFNLKYVKNYSVFLKIKDYFKVTIQ